MLPSPSPSPSPSPDLMLREDQRRQTKGSHSAISCSVVTRLIHSVSWTVKDALKNVGEDCLQWCSESRENYDSKFPIRFRLSRVTRLPTLAEVILFLISYCMTRFPGCIAIEFSLAHCIKETVVPTAIPANLQGLEV